MNDLLKDLKSEGKIVVAYRVCYICQKKKEKLDDSIWDTLSYSLDVGIKEAFSQRKCLVNERQFEYVELITSKDEVFYIYEDKNEYEKFSKLTLFKNIGIFKKDTVIGKITKKNTKSYYKRMYPIKNLIKEIEGKLVRLKDGECIYENEFARVRLSSYKILVDNTQSYEKDDKINFISQAEKTFSDMRKESINMWSNYLKEIESSIRLNKKLANDLGVDLVTVRNEYKSVIEFIKISK